MRRPSILVAVLLACAAPALAAEGHGDKKDKVDERTVNVSTIPAPIVWRGRLVNYVFVATRLKVGPSGDVEKLRGREPYLRDALVRAAHRTPFVDPHDLARVDERAVAAALMREAARLEGPRTFTGAEVMSQQPRQRSGLPHLDAGPATAGRVLTP